MTPDEYRAHWNLPADYPMVAPNYAEQRRELAKKIGLGPKAAAAAASARPKPDALSHDCPRWQERAGRRSPPLSCRGSPCTVGERRRGCILQERPACPEHRPRGAVRRKRAAHHRAAARHRARALRSRGSSRCRERCMSAPRRSTAASRSPPSIAPCACSKRRASSTGTISAMAARATKLRPKRITTI